MMTIPRPRTARPPFRTGLAPGAGRAAALALATLSLALGCVGSAAAHPARPAAGAAARIAYPFTTVLTNAAIGHWAAVVQSVAARTEPARGARVVTVLATVTGDGTQNIVLILAARAVNPTQTWYLVRLPILPNNSTGWVPRSALGTVTPVETHLYVNRETETAVLKRLGKVIFTTRVGVGRPYWPTPAGQFYVRDELTDLRDPFYGPVAFGTSARSAVLTEWPGGGFIGVHGTDEPGLIPGHISHGCIRIVNSQIMELARLLQVGSPVTIT
jgi:lipoprotein-anchoring transpeptidase ErfK/SrfK